LTAWPGKVFVVIGGTAMAIATLMAAATGVAMGITRTTAMAIAIMAASARP
jgi:hypothetical protein